MQFTHPQTAAVRCSYIYLRIFCCLRINPLSLVQICTPIVNQFKDPAEAVQFLEKLGDKVKTDTEAFVLTKVLIGKIQLMQYNNLGKTKVSSI